MIFRKGLALLLSFTVFLSSCGPDVSPTTLKNIIGKDDRQMIEDSSPQTLDFPVLPLVHRVVDPKNKEATKYQFICNVTVIDPSFAITPFHCLEPMIDEQLKAGQTGPYSPDYLIQSHLNRYHEFQVFDVLEDLDLVLLSVLEPIRNKSIYEMGSFQDGEKLSIFSVLSDFINARNVLILSPRDLEIDKTAGGPILAPPPVDDPRADISVIGLEEISTPIRFWSRASLSPTPSLSARDGGIVCGEHGSCSPIHPEQYPDFDQENLVGNRYVSDLIYRFQETSRVIRDKNDVLVYDLDTVRSASGSPLLQNGRIVGIHLGYDPKLKRNVGISLDAIYSRYSEEKNNKLSKKNNGRDIFTDKDGYHWSVDTQHGHFEKLNKKGKHQGAFDIDGNQVKPVDSSGRHDIII